MTATLLTTQRTRQLERNVAIFYAMNLTIAAAFISGNWIFFWLRVMTMGQLGVIDALAFAFGMLAEIPTGALGDVLGRRRTLIAAMLCGVVGWWVMGLADDVTALVIGFLFTQVSWAFYSGAGTALAYDSLLELGGESRFERVISRTHSYELLVNVVATWLGGLMYALHFRLPHLAWGALYLLAFVASLWLVEPQGGTQERFSWRRYLAQFGAGFRELSQAKLRYFVVLFFVGLGVNFIVTTGLIMPAMAISFGYNADAQAALFGVLGVLAALGTASVPWVRQRLSDLGYAALIGLVLGVGALLTALPLGAWGFLALGLLRVSGAMANPLMFIVVNREIPSENRATTLSTMAMLTKIPYVFTAMLAGAMIENEAFALFNLGIAGFAVGVVGLVWVLWGLRRLRHNLR